MDFPVPMTFRKFVNGGAAMEHELRKVGTSKSLNVSLSRRDLQRGPMYTLFHHSFCPHSRFIRLALGEHGLDLRLVEERGWERREGFLALNPAGTTPVLVSESRLAIPGIAIIAEFLDETYGAGMG